MPVALIIGANNKPTAIAILPIIILTYRDQIKQTLL
jgi:hypothetical protein